MENVVIKSIGDTAVLYNGVRMPWLGLGVLHISEGEQVENAVRWALAAGYRHIDTAAVYGNIVTIPKSEQQHRIQSNAELYDFELEPQDLLLIDGLDRGERLGQDPDNFHFDV